MYSQKSALEIIPEVEETPRNIHLMENHEGLFETNIFSGSFTRFLSELNLHPDQWGLLDNITGDQMKDLMKPNLTPKGTNPIAIYMNSEPILEDIEELPETDDWLKKTEKNPDFLPKFYEEFDCSSSVSLSSSEYSSDDDDEEEEVLMPKCVEKTVEKTTELAQNHRVPTTTMKKTWNKVKNFLKHNRNVRHYPALLKDFITSA